MTAGVAPAAASPVPATPDPVAATAAAGAGTPALVAWVRSRTADDLPDATATRARTALLHHALCGARGQKHPAVRAVADVVAGDRPEDVAFRDAVAGHSTLQEDMHVPSVSHHGTVVWPTALALVAADEDLTLDDLLTAAATGYEVGGRVGGAVAPQGLPARARPTGTFGPLSAWAVAVSLVRPDTAVAASALGLAANAAAGLNGWAWQGGEEVYLHSGQAAAAGVRAVRLASAGVQGSPDVLFGRQGYLQTLGGEPAVQALAAQAWPGASDRWVVDELVFKGHPACNYTQTVIEAVGSRPEGSAPAPGTPLEVRVTAAAAAYPGCDGPPPWSSLLAAQMSIQFAVAAALQPEGYADVLAAGPQRWVALEDLGRRTTVVPDADLDAAYPARQGAIVGFTGADGAPVVVALDDLRGLDGPQVRDQLRSVGAAAGAAATTEALVSAVDGDGAVPAHRIAALVHELWAAVAAS